MASQERDMFEFALDSNAAWANYKGHQNPALFKTLANGQSPKILWIGCSDSRVPETTILGLNPGDVFVHRNVANIISLTDINSQAVIEYAVVYLKVSHIIVCGHSACGGCGAALSEARVGGVIDAWIAPLKALRKTHEEELKSIKDDKARAIKLAELNVKSGVDALLSTYFIEEAIRERGLKVHGCVYDVACGKITNLKCGNAE